MKKILTLVACLLMTSPALGFQELDELQKRIVDAKTERSESKLDQCLRDIEEMYLDLSDKKNALELIFDIACSYQFLNPKKAQALLVRTRDITNDVALKGRCHYQLGFANWGTLAGAQNYELAVLYFEQLGRAGQSPAILSNSYANAAGFYYLDGNARKAEILYQGYFEHDDIATVDIPLTMSCLHNLLGVKQELDADFDVELLSKATRFLNLLSNGRRIKKVARSTRGILKKAHEQSAGYSDLEKLAKCLRKKLTEFGSTEERLAFELEWQLLAFIHCVREKEIRKDVAQSIVDQLGGIRELFGKLPTPIGDENRKLDFSLSESMHCQSLLLAGLCSKSLKSENAFEIFSEIRERGVQLRYCPVMQSYRNRRLMALLRRAFDLVMRGNEIEIEIDMFLKAFERGSDRMVPPTNEPSGPKKDALDLCFLLFDQLPWFESSLQF